MKDEGRMNLRTAEEAGRALHMSEKDLELEGREIGGFSFL